MQRMSVSDAMTHISYYSPKVQSKIHHWYPKLQVAQKAAFDAWKEMELLFKEPPVFVLNHSYMQRRKNIISAWKVAWTTWETMSTEFETASSPEEEIEQLRQQVANLTAQLSSAHPCAPSDDQNPKAYT